MHDNLFHGQVRWLTGWWGLEQYGCRQEEEVLLNAVIRIIRLGLHWSLLLLCHELEWIDGSSPWLNMVGVFHGVLNLMYAFPRIF
jgi:hypothetical protein